MNDGFFNLGQLKKYDKSKPLPPVLNLPMREVKAKDKPVYTSKIPQLVMDLECFPNYFLCKFKNVETSEVITFEQTFNNPLDSGKIKRILMKNEIITFNGNAFDIPLLKFAMEDKTNKEIKDAANEIINTDIRAWQFEKKYKLPKLKIKHIDLIELTPGILSLKVYGARLGCPVMMDLPYPESRVLYDQEMDEVDEYCEYDLDDTIIIFKELRPQIEIRRVMSDKYDIDLMSKSDAQIAEAVIGAELAKKTGEEYKKTSVHSLSFYYKAPSFITFVNPVLKEAMKLVTTTPFILGASGKPIMPPELTKLKIKIGHATYKMGMGGLHSQEKSVFHVSTEKYSLWDWDVSSFYPMIMLICNLYPKQLGEIFLDIFEDIVNTRLDAKANKDKLIDGVSGRVIAEVLKIVINGTFGKLGSQHSIMTSPDLMIQVTVTGQLVLLMLIDMMEQKGFSILSGNTDGIIIKCPTGKEDMMKFIINRWEKITGFEMESAKYAGVFSRDVNDYIAFKYAYDYENKVWLDEIDEIKTKGCFAPASIKISPNNDICSTAMIEYIKSGTPFEQTIKSCFDVTKFLSVTTVNNGGAVYNGMHLGRAVRFYHAKNATGGIYVKDNGNLVSMTSNCKPLMKLPENNSIPDDLDYEWYINRCRDLFYPSHK